jgi:hypothetical protein
MPQQPILDVVKFEDMIDRRGRAVKWQEAITCSCLNLDSGQPSYSCAACHGKGFVYKNSIIAKAMVTSVTLNKDWQDMAGLFEVGDAVMTVPKRTPKRLSNGVMTGQFDDNPLFYVGMYDKVTLTDDEYKTSEVLVKAVPIGKRVADTLLNEDVTRVQSVVKFDAVTGAETPYSLGTDYQMQDNLVDWLPGGNSPADGEQYSVTYFHRPTYVVIATLPKPRHQDGQDFPRYVALRYLSGGVIQS